MPLTRILCPVDLSPLSACLVRHAMAMAEGDAAHLRVLHTIEPLLLQAATVVGSAADLEAATMSELERTVWEASTPGVAGPPVSLTVAEGAPEVAILRASTDADLIVMGMHGMSGFSKACFGSTLERVLRETAVPVLALRPSIHDHGVECPPRAIRCVVAAIDFQQPSMDAARVAAAFAERHRADLVLLHVMPALPPLGRWREGVEQQHLLRRERILNELTTLAEELQRGKQAPQIDLREGKAADEILACATATPGTLVVMGLARPERPFARPGSVAWRVLNGGAAAVLAVPSLPPVSRAVRRRAQVESEAYTESA